MFTHKHSNIRKSSPEKKKNGSVDMQVERGYSLPQHNLLKEQGKGLFYLFYLCTLAILVVQWDGEMYLSWESSDRLSVQTLIG